MDNNIQSVNPQPPIKPYIPPKTETKKTNKGLIIGIAAGLVFIAAIVLVLVLLVFPSSGSRTEASEPMPLIYMEDDEVFLAVGTRTVELKDAAVIDSDYVKQVNSQISYDGRYFIYLADVDEETGAGDLMLIDLKADLKPRVIEKEVCTAKISALGDNIIFFRDIEDGKGTLYYAGLGKEAKEIEEDVLIEEFKISVDGRSYYYFTQSNENTRELYVCVKGAEPEKVMELSIDKGESIYIRDLTNEGTLIYEYSEYDDSKLYVYKNGKEEKIASDAKVQIAFDPEYEKILYSDGDSLYYKAENESKERITKDYHDVRLPYYNSHIAASYDIMYETWYGLNSVYDTHFVLTEIEDDIDEVTIYEIRIGSEPIKIAEVDTWRNYDISPNFSWVVFEHESELCVAYKDRNEWSDRIELCENYMQAMFDENSQYLYYIELSNEDDEYGDLYRYELTSRDHEPELLQYDVNGFSLYNGAILTGTTDDEIYRVYSKDEKKLLFDEEYIGLKFAPNGFYIFTEANDYDIFYININGDEEEICFDAAEFLDIANYVTHNYRSAVPNDIIDDLSKVYQDVKFIQDVLNDKEVPEDIDTYKDLDVHLSDLDELMDRDDIGDEALEMIDSFYQGLVQLEAYLDADVESDEEQQALGSMNKYFDKARELFEQIIGESTVDPLY